MNPPAPKAWKKIAARVGETFPLGRLQMQVRGWLELHPQRGEPWAVAVSGGADSVGLLLLLWAHYPKQRQQLLVLHFDHAMRPEAPEDARFVESLAKSLGVRFATARRTTTGPASEAVLRDARWDFFNHQLAAMEGRMIFLGHQRDDIAETMLMRLARGSGAGGLCVPRPVQEREKGVVVLRPLLDIPRHELRHALEAAGATWREDSSNAEDGYLRNRIRKQVIPAWRAVLGGGRDLDTGVARARAALQDDDDALCALADEAYGELAVGEPFSLARFAQQPPAVTRRGLWRWLNENGVRENLNANAFHALLIAVLQHHPGRWSAGHGRWLVLDEVALSLTSGAEAAAPWRKQVLKPGTTIHLPSGAQLSCEVVKVGKKLLADLKSGKVNPLTTAWLAWPKKMPALHARPWQPGDRYQPLGAPGSRKLQDLFTDKKISIKERRLLPVVCNVDDEPLWVPGFAPAHAWRVTAAAKTALRLTYRPH